MHFNIIEIVKYSYIHLLLWEKWWIFCDGYKIYDEACFLKFLNCCIIMYWTSVFPLSSSIFNIGDFILCISLSLYFNIYIIFLDIAIKIIYFNISSIVSWLNFFWKHGIYYIISFNYYNNYIILILCYISTIWLYY